MRIRHFIVVLSATFMLALVGVPEIHAQEPGSATVAEDPGTRTEWGFLGYSYSTALGGGHGFNIGLPILKWGSIYWQTLEYVVAFPQGEFSEYTSAATRASIATVAGYRISLNASGTHELRVGLGAGWMLEDERADCQWEDGPKDCDAGDFSSDYYGFGAMPEIGWLWRLAPGVGIQSLRLVQVKLRGLIPMLALNKSEESEGEGDRWAYCGDNGGCPWEGEGGAWTPDVSLSLSVAVGF